MDKLHDISQQEWERLESYVHNGMAPEERAAFEAQLSNDVLLQEKVAEMQLLLVGMSEAVLHQKLAVFHQELPAEENQYGIGHRRPSSLKTWLVAASILLLAGVGGWLLLAKDSSEEQLFAAYFKPDPGLITAMSATDNYAFEKAMIDYKKRDYPAAISTWDSLQKGQPANDTLHYFLGVAQLAAGNSKEGVKQLQKVTATSASFFKEDAYWYLGLALLKEGKRGEAAAALQQATHPSKNNLLKEIE